jgi:hypothetical protein
MTTRLRLVIENPRQLLSGCVTDYAVEQLRGTGNNPAAVVVPGLNHYAYPAVSELDLVAGALETCSVRTSISQAISHRTSAPLSQGFPGRLGGMGHSRFPSILALASLADAQNITIDV